MRPKMAALIHAACVLVPKNENKKEFVVHFKKETLKHEPIAMFSKVELFWSSYWGGYSFFAENSDEFISIANELGVEYEIYEPYKVGNTD